MEAKAAQKERSRRRRTLGKLGICMACTRLAISRYPKNSRTPVMFCEEFSSGKDRPRRKEQAPAPVFMEIPAPGEGNKDKFSNNYIGLCKRCDQLYACRLTKPGGGTWLCEFFEERKAANRSQHSCRGNHDIKKHAEIGIPRGKLRLTLSLP